MTRIAERERTGRDTTWYDRISPQSRSIVDSVVELCNKQHDPKWYVVADSLIDTLKIPAKQKSVALVLKELAAKRGKR